MKIKRFNLKFLSLTVGIALIFFSFFLLIYNYFKTQDRAAMGTEYVNLIQDIIPEPYSAVIEPRSDNKMPSLSIDNENFVAIIDFPANSRAFPVITNSDKSNVFPRLYSGSIYDSTIIIAASNKKGCIDFAQEISVGDTVLLTDMTGGKYSYQVADIKYRKKAGDTTLNAIEDDLTIFIKNCYSFEFIILYCNAFGK